MASGELVKKADQRVTVRGWFEAQKGEIARAVPRHIDPERLIRVALTACVQNPKLLSCTRESLMQATLQSASLGLMPDGVMGQAYLLPYGDKATFQIGYQGLIELAYRTDRIAGIIADVVHEKDKFEFHREVKEDFFVHRPYEGDDEPGPVTHAYCIIRRKDGTASVTVLPKSKIEKEHRAHSRAKNDGPWVGHWSAMARKTAILVALKYEQKSTELARAIAVEERVDQGIDMPSEQILDAVEVKAEPQQSALDKLAGKAPEVMAQAATVIDIKKVAQSGGAAAMKYDESSNVPACAGCGNNVPAPKAEDGEGRLFHAECLAVLKKK
jgi:recombination protein RecT